MFNKYRIDSITESNTDNRFADVVCQVWHSDSPDEKWFVKLNIKMSGLVGTPRYKAVEDALVEVKDVPDITDMEDPKEGEGSSWSI